MAHQLEALEQEEVRLIATEDSWWGLVINKSSLGAYMVLLRATTWVTARLVIATAQFLSLPLPFVELPQLEIELLI
jgi:hypothetical protein